MNNSLEIPDQSVALEIVLPYLKRYGIVANDATIGGIREVDLRELAVRWSISGSAGGGKKSKKIIKGDVLLQSLYTTACNISKSGDSLSRKLISSKSVDAFLQESLLPAKQTVKFPTNYFGLKPYTLKKTGQAIVYQCRKPMASSYLEHSVYSNSQVNDSERTIHLDATAAKVADTEGDGGNYTAQRKVAKALLTMSRNPLMITHFVHKGGIDAIVRLIAESYDLNVLVLCAQCVDEVTLGSLEFAKVLLERHIISSITTLVERGDDAIKVSVARILINLSNVDDSAEFIVNSGVLSLAQTLLTSSEQTEMLCCVLVSLCNVAGAFSGQDAESVVRIFLSSVKKLDAFVNYDHALFILELIANLTRINHFCSILVDESILPLLLHSMEVYPVDDVINIVIEAMVNLSMLRKNRREMAACGISNYLERIFSVNKATTRAYVLMMIGNFLNSGLFHERIAKEELISNILDNMLDPSKPSQFLAVSFCISQLTFVESSARVMVQCNVIKIVLGMIRQSPPDALPYLWTLLVNLSQKPQYFNTLLSEADSLFEEIEGSSESKHKEYVAQLSLNITLNSKLDAFLQDHHIKSFVKTLKYLFSLEIMTIRTISLTALVNLAALCPRSRLPILGQDLIQMMEDAGIDHPQMNIKFVSLLNSISNEENCCIRLIDAGALKFLVAVHDTFQPDAASLELRASAKSKVFSLNHDLKFTHPNNPLEMGESLSAATYHNLALKRAVIGPGMLTCLMSLMGNTKSLRVMHCVRAFASMSQHSKSKIVLAKEKRIIPLLTATMRYGCEEADRVQYFGSIVICNILATSVEKGILEHLIKTGGIVDLVVVTLLRINSVTTKEFLGRGLFNLLARADFRSQMVNNLDILGAMLELAKVESSELLELCTRSLYNVSCETLVYKDKLRALKIPQWLVIRTCLSSQIPGIAKSSAGIKILCGMTMANISFEKSLALDLLSEKKLADSANAVFSLESDEATYCATVTMFNISFLPTCHVLADSIAIPMLVKAMKKSPLLPTQLAIGCLCNFSQFPQFHEQLREVAMVDIVAAISSPQLHISVKIDAIHIMFNLVTQNPPSRLKAVQSDCTSALWKVMKSQDDEELMKCIGRIFHMMALEATDDAVQKKMLTEGVMPALLRLAKLEIPSLKYDVASAIFSLTIGSETLKVLKWDAVDILFWLTLHDCLGLFDPIRKYVANALRNFTSSKSDVMLLCSEDRFIAVLKALAKSKNEDVLWQTAGILYNVIGIPEAMAIVMSHGAMALIFEVAASGYESVRHVCSATLHMVQDRIPDMEDPAVLQLLLCLLEVDGDRFADLESKSVTVKQVNVSIEDDKIYPTKFEHDGTSFQGTWITLTSTFDNMFLPALITIPCGDSMSCPVRSGGTSSSNILVAQKYYQYSDFSSMLRQDEVSATLQSDDHSSNAGDVQSIATSLADTHIVSHSSSAPPLVPPKPGDPLKKIPGVHAQSLQVVSNAIDTSNNKMESSDRGGSKGVTKSYSGELLTSSIDGYSASSTSKIKFPKIKVKRTMPEDTVNAIKASIANDLGSTHLQYSPNKTMALVAVSKHGNHIA